MHAGAHAGGMPAKGVTCHWATENPTLYCSPGREAKESRFLLPNHRLSSHCTLAGTLKELSVRARNRSTVDTAVDGLTEPRVSRLRDKQSSRAGGRLSSCSENPPVA